MGPGRQINLHVVIDMVIVVRVEMTIAIAIPEAMHTTAATTLMIVMITAAVDVVTGMIVVRPTTTAAAAAATPTGIVSRVAIMH